MSKTRNKIILTLSIIMIIILLSVGFAKAEDVQGIIGIGNEFYHRRDVKFDDGLTVVEDGIGNDKRWYCIEHGGRLRHDEKYAGKAYSFMLTESNAYRYNYNTDLDKWCMGFTQEGWQQCVENNTMNAKFAYILANTIDNESGQKIEPGYQNANGEYTYKQIAIWRNFHDWWNTINKYEHVVRDIRKFYCWRFSRSRWYRDNTRKFK